MKVGELFAELKLDDSDYRRGMSGVESSTGRSTGAMAGMMGKVGVAAAGAAVAGGAALVGVGVKGVMAFADVEKGMNEVFTLMPGVSEAAMGEMTGDVLNFAKEMGTLPEDVIPALYQALSAGVPPGNVFDFMETANKAAIGGITGLETSVDGITSVVNAYGSDVISAAEASDMMFTAVRLGKTDFGQLSASLFNVLPTASALGVGFGDVTAALAAMTAQGVPTSVATTQLRSLMNELAKDGSKASDAFKEIAGEGFADFIAGGGNVNDALGIMAQAADDNGVALQDMFGSVEAGAAALTLFDNPAFVDGMEEMAASAGATDAAFGQMDQGLSRSWDKIKATTSVALAKIGEALAPLVEKMVDFFARVLPPLIDGVIVVFQTLAAILGPIFEFIKSLFTGTSETASESGEGITTMWTHVGAIVKEIAALIGTVLGWIGRVWEAHGSKVMAVVSSVFATIGAIITAAMRIIRGVIEVVVGLITGDWSKAWNGVKNIFGGLWDAIVALLRNVLNVFRAVVGNGLDGIGTFFKSFPGKVLGWLSNLPRLLVNLGRQLIEGLIRGITDRIARVRDTLTGLTARLTSWKGPPARDARLFTPAGESLMDGLMAGIAARVPDLRAQLGGLTADLGGMVGVAGAGGPSYNVSIGSINNPSGEASETSIVREMRKQQFLHGGV